MSDKEDLEESHVAERSDEVRRAAREAVRSANALGNRPPRSWTATLNQPALLWAAVAVGLLIIGLVIYSLVSSESGTETSSTARQPAASPAGPAPAEGESIWSRIFGEGAPTFPQPEPLPARLARIALRLALAALLSAALAFRPRKDLPIVQRNPYVMQSQILLGVVAAALMMVVADNAARAFGIFAAATLVRFRTTVRDPKEITVILVSLGVGLSAGVGRWEIAVILTAFVFALLLVLEYYEVMPAMRSFELTVEAHDVDRADEVLREVFEKYEIVAEVRSVELNNEGKGPAEISYSVNVSLLLSIDRISEEIASADPENFVSVKWDQKKSKSYIYR